MTADARANVDPVTHRSGVEFPWAAELADRFGRTVQSMGQGRALTPGAIHRAHRQAIRLRVVLAVAARAGATPGGELPRLEYGLRRTGRWIGRVRNADVSRDVLERAHRVGPEPQGDRLWRRTRRELRRSGRHRREQLEKRMAGRRTLHLLRRASAASSDIARIAPVAWEAAWWMEWDSGRDAIRTAMSEAQRKGSMRKLHRLRIALRRARLLHAVGKRTAVADLPALPAAWVELCQGIGRLRDLKLALRRLAPEGGPSAMWVRALTRERVRLRRQLLARIVREAGVRRPATVPPPSSTYGASPGAIDLVHVEPVAGELA